MEIRLISRNIHKIQETTTILGMHGIQVIPLDEKIEELQTENTDRLVKDKLIKAYRKVGRPLIVEHTGLFLEYINGLPGGLTQIFWDKLGADLFTELFGNTKNTAAVARTKIGYCDGKNFHFFEGKIKGSVATSPRGDVSFQWDCVFIPDGFQKTFAELGETKNEISMRRKALDAFASFLTKKQA